MTVIWPDLADLPRLCADLKPVGGRIKDQPEDFAVEELPLYTASGEGPHLYLTLRRSGQTTRQVVDTLAGIFGMSANAIGYAGLKDKEAVTTQTFSLETKLDLAAAESLARSGPWELLTISRHQNKLKVGHLLGNRFTVVLSEPEGGLAEATAIGDRLKAKGVLNYFGVQRFGQKGDNAEAGLALLRSGRRPGKGWRDKFLLSALQSAIYNYYLAWRVKAGIFETVLAGDVCKKHTTGGLFISEDGVSECPRFQAGELSHAGPIFGSKMMSSHSEAAELERQVLADLGLAPGELDRAGVGDRRLNRLLVSDLTVAERGRDLVFTFALPKGAYATSVMREFIWS